MPMLRKLLRRSLAAAARASSRGPTEPQLQEQQQHQQLQQEGARAVAGGVLQLDGDVGSMDPPRGSYAAQLSANGRTSLARLVDKDVVLLMPADDDDHSGPKPVVVAAATAPALGLYRAAPDALAAAGGGGSAAAGVQSSTQLTAAQLLATGESAHGGSAAVAPHLQAKNDTGKGAAAGGLCARAARSLRETCQVRRRTAHADAFPGHGYPSARTCSLASPPGPSPRWWAAPHSATGGGACAFTAVRGVCSVRPRSLGRLCAQSTWRLCVMAPSVALLPLALLLLMLSLGIWAVFKGASNEEGHSVDIAFAGVRWGEVGGTGAGAGGAVTGEGGRQRGHRVRRCAGVRWGERGQAQAQLRRRLRRVGAGRRGGGLGQARQRTADKGAGGGEVDGGR